MPRSSRAPRRKALTVTASMIGPAALTGVPQGLRALMAAAVTSRTATAGAQGDPGSGHPRSGFTPVQPRALRFPEDHGAHPGYRIEWWYLTGWLSRPQGPDFGFQITFFRSATGYPEDNPSRFAPKQILLAHAAIALPEKNRLVHAERMARSLPPLAHAQTADTDVHIGSGAQQWSLRRDARTDSYVARIEASELSLQLTLSAHEPPVPQGQAGYSRKGPHPLQASHYYSRPQLDVSGTMRLGPTSNPTTRVNGRAWFDHEWSSEILGDDAVGWDWVGINLDDGGALMAFRIRDAQGRTLWHEASLRVGGQGALRTGLGADFEPIRWWTSMRSGARWPIAQQLRIEGHTLVLEPLLDDQELVMRGVTYWEGAVTVKRAGQRIGRGYLELTGYAGRIRL